MLNQTPEPNQKPPQEIPPNPAKPDQEPPLKSKQNRLPLSLLSGLLLFAINSSSALTNSSYYKHNAYHYKGESAPVAPLCTSCPYYAFGGGPYVGLGLGLRTNYTSDPSVYKGLEGTLFAGYGSLVDQSIYLAGEILFGNSLQLQSYRSSSDIRKVPKSSWTIGLSVIPGYVLTENMMSYLRVGVVRTAFTDASDSATGGQLGLGLQTALTKHWDLRGEYIYNFYQAVSDTKLSNVKSDQFNVGLVYKFL